MTNFITNTGSASLKHRLSTLIKESLELKFLVGFFYFSGISEQIENLKANPQPDRKALDEVVFRALGLTDQEIKALYAGLLELTANRLRKAKTFTS